MQAQLRGEVRREFEVTSSADYFDILVCKPHKLTQISPSEVQGCNIQEAQVLTKGSVIDWNYTIEGQACVAKEIIENLDVENKKITYRVIEGDVLNSYKTFLIHLHVTPGDSNTSIVKMNLEYEKQNEDVVEPTSIADFLVNLSKLADAHLKA